MASQGPNFPGTGASATGGAPEDEIAWSTPENITAEDGSEAQITHATFDTGDVSERLVAVNFGFSIPSDATIDGLVVSIRRRAFAGAARDFRVQLRNTTAALIGDNKAGVVSWPGSLGTTNYGTSTDGWNAGLTPAIVNHANFGVELSVEATAANTDVGVDRITITVHYTEASSDVSGSGGLSFPFSIAASGSAVTPISASGGLAFGFSTASVAVEKLSGAGGTTFPFSAAAAGEEGFPLSGGLSFPFSLSAVGEELLLASGGVSFPFSLSGSGTTEADDSVTGAGDLSFSFSAAGAAEEALAGSGALSFSFGVAGSGEELLSASGGVAFAFSAAGAGQHVETDDVAGAGGLAFGFNSSAVGSLSLVASGGFQFDFSVISSGLAAQPIELEGGLSFSMSVQGVIDLPINVIGGDVLQLLRGKARARYPWNRGAFPRR